MSAPKFAPKLARWFANDLVITAAVRAASGESSGQLPGNFRAVSKQLAGNVSHNAGGCPHHGWRNGSQVTWQFPVKSTPQTTKQPSWRPRSSPRGVRLGVRATSDKSLRQFPGSFWVIPHETRSGQKLSRDIPRSFQGHELATFFRGHAHSSFTNCPQTYLRQVLELTATGIY